MIIALLLVVSSTFALQQQYHHQQQVTSRKKACNAHDVIIYKKRHREFKKLFRSFGGMWTSKKSYNQKIIDAVGFSRSCASCYSEAYMCGFHSCWQVCYEEGEKCDVCLVRYKCVENCNKCTKFV